MRARGILGRSSGLLFEQAPTKIEFQTEVFESGVRVRSGFYTVVRVVSFFGDGAFDCHQPRCGPRRRRRRRVVRRSWCRLVLAFRISVGIRVVVRVGLSSAHVTVGASYSRARGVAVAEK